MKAILFTRYGSPDVLQFREVVKPIPRGNQVLIQVHAASVNSWDWELLRGTPLANRLMFGLVKPRIQSLGADIAGIVEAVGPDCKQFRPGDEAFGDLSGSGWGGFAEYVAAPENALMLKPSGLTLEQAAAVPQAADLAMQGLRKGRIQSGQKVLIIGAGGGVGTFAIQIAKSFGAEVTGVDSTPKLDLMGSIGADHVIDYTKEDFTRNGRSYDLILDVAAHRSIFDYRRALNPDGICVLVGGSLASIFPILLLGPLISRTGTRKMGILMARPNRELAFVKELLEAGKVKPVIDRSYPLSEVAEALRYFGKGEAKGKVVITVVKEDRLSSGKQNEK